MGAASVTGVIGVMVVAVAGVPIDGEVMEDESAAADDADVSDDDADSAEAADPSPPLAMCSSGALPIRLPYTLVGAILG